MAVLASDLALSPVTPEILAARELRRGTLQLIEDIAPYRHLGIEPPPLHLLINRVHPVSSNARLIQQALRQVFQGQPGVRVLDTDVPAIEGLSARSDARPAGTSGGIPPAGGPFRAPRRWVPCARWPASCSRRGKSVLRSSPAEARREGPAMASAHELARGHKAAASADRVRPERGLEGGAHPQRAPAVHEARLRADLHQLDGQRPPRSAMPVRSFAAPTAGAAVEDMASPQESGHG